MEVDALSNRVIGFAIEVHRELGPGLLESTYEQCLARELSLNGITFQLQSRHLLGKLIPELIELPSRRLASAKDGKTETWIDYLMSFSIEVSTPRTE